MIENKTFTEIRRELSRGISALYPEWSSLLSNQELERRLYERFRKNNKDYNLSLSGSPNHGSQYWVYEGTSPLFSISTFAASPEVIEEQWMRIDNLLESLKTDTIALFTPRDVRDANNIYALPKAFRNDPSALDEYVAKDKQNGIILVKP